MDIDSQTSDICSMFTTLSFSKQEYEETDMLTLEQQHKLEIFKNAISICGKINMQKMYDFKESINHHNTLLDYVIEILLDRPIDQKYYFDVNHIANIIRVWIAYFDAYVIGIDDDYLNEKMLEFGCICKRDNINVFSFIISNWNSLYEKITNYESHVMHLVDPLYVYETRFTKLTLNIFDFFDMIDK